MKNFLRQNGIWLLAIALLLSLVITLSSVLLGGSANPLANVVQAVTSPIRGGISAVLDWADGVSTYVFRYGEMQQSWRICACRCPSWRSRSRRAKRTAGKMSSCGIF